LENRDSHTNGQRGGYGGGGGYRSERGYGGRGHGGFGGGFGGPRPFRPSPVKVGEEFDVKIESMSKRGDAGVAKVEGLVIFVAGTKVGDNVRIRITKVGRGYATADIAGQPGSTGQAGSTGQPGSTGQETTVDTSSAELDKETTSTDQ
jgi:predicted RNA-binding protein with TRAM domain